MATAIAFEEFKPEVHDFIVYRERLEQRFLALDVTEDKKVPILLSSIGQSAYKTLKDMCFPEVPAEKTFKDLADILKRQYSSKTNPWKQRKLFFEMKQQDGEAIIEFLTRIKKIAAFCEFEASLEDIIKMKLVTGLVSTSIFDRLCEEKSRHYARKSRGDCALQGGRYE